MQKSDLKGRSLQGIRFFYFEFWILKGLGARPSIFDSQQYLTHLWPFSKSKFNLKSVRVNLVAPVSPIKCLPYLPNVRAIRYKLDRKGLPGSEIQM